VHFDGDDAISLTSLAPAAFDVERKPSGQPAGGVRSIANSSRMNVNRPV
jgi:hypothetical protein